MAKRDWNGAWGFMLNDKDTFFNDPLKFVSEEPERPQMEEQVERGEITLRDLMLNAIDAIDQHQWSEEVMAEELIIALEKFLKK